MKITEQKVNKNAVGLYDLKAGDTFIYADANQRDVHMVLGTVEPRLKPPCRPPNQLVARLCDGLLFTEAADELVILVEASLDFREKAS